MRRLVLLTLIFWFCGALAQGRPPNLEPLPEPPPPPPIPGPDETGVRIPVQERSEEHTSELQSRFDLVCRLLLEKKKNMPMLRTPARSANTPSRPARPIC